MFKAKKGDGLSLNIIIIAILALIVLVVLITIFTGKLGGFRQQSDSCEKNGGACIANVPNADGTAPCSGQYQKQLTAPCYTTQAGKSVVDTEKICCLST